MSEQHSDDLSMGRFAAVQGSEFTITALMPDGVSANEVSVRLDSLSTRGVTGDYEQYAMQFVGPATPLLQQGTYQFTHAKLGQLMLFVVPVGQDAASVRYEVCVSRKLA